jgi:hypothetical protein
MLPVLRTEQAETDLAEILDYLEQSFAPACHTPKSSITLRTRRSLPTAGCEMA